MGFRGGLKQGGGFLNNVDGIITGYEFTNMAPQKGGGEAETEWLYLVPSIRVDGASEDVNQHLFLGAVENYELSADAHTAYSINADGERLEITTLGLKTPAGKFLASLIDGGFPESSLPDLEGGDPLNLEAMIGTRCRFTQQKDEEGTAKRGKRRDKKTGKEYDRTDTVVATVHSLPQAAGKTNGKAKVGVKSAPKTPSTRRREPQPEIDIAELAASTLTDILGETTDGSLAKSKLSMAILKKLMKDPNREAVREYLFDDDNLAGIEGVAYNKKKQLIELDA